jgi:hypothetical protein
MQIRTVRAIARAAIGSNSNRANRIIVSIGFPLKMAQAYQEIDFGCA